MNSKIVVAILIIFVIYSLIYIKPLLTTKTVPLVSHKGDDKEGFTIFRTFKSRKIDEKMFERCHKRWFDMNNSISMEWFDDVDCDAFMKSQSPKIYEAYTTLKPGAFKADLFRLCLLYERGGVYADAQTMPYVSMNEMFTGCFKENQKHRFVSVLDPKSSGGGIHNGFIFCSPEHPFVKRCIERIVNNVKNRDYTDSVLGITGPICLRRAINDVLERNENARFFEGFNDFGDLSLYLYNLKWGPSQFIYKNGKAIMCKKHCNLTTFLAKMKKSAYERMWKNRDVYNFNC
jgi:mannosyltransferase OCH1-like enzyme